MTTVNDRIKTSFTKVLNSTDNMYANWFEKLGVKNPHGNVPLMSAKATETLGVEPSTSMGDARINFLHDRIIENINDAAPVNEATFKENILRLMDTGEQLGEELLRAVPKEYRDHVHHLSLQFKDGTSFRNRTMAHLLKIARSLTFIVEEVLSYTLNIMNRIMSMAVQTIMVILDLPFYIPFVTPLWKKMMGSEDLSLMSLFNLIGAIPTTLFYKMYYGRDPFSRNDITALESNKIPQLFLYQWNHHPLTRTTNVHEMKRRTGIFDWIARMSAAYMLQFFVTISLEWPSGPDMPQTPQERRSKNFFAVGGLIIKFLRMIFVYLVCLWIYPVSQLDSTEPGVIIQDMKYPYEVIQVWWYSYQIGLAARVASFANHGKFGAIGDFIWFSVIGSVQAICSNVVAYDIVRATNMKDWKRVLVNVAGITAWEFDSVSFLVGLAPPSAVKNTIEKASLISMYLYVYFV